MILSMRRWKESGKLNVPPNMFRWFIDAGLVLAIAWVVSGWFIRQDGLQTMQSGTTAGQSQGKADISVQALINSAPFGLRKKVLGSLRKQAVKAPSSSRRDIKLTGTVLAGKDSVAIVSPGKRKKTEVFHPGDTIAPGVILKTVEKQRILIKVGNRLEAVSMEKMNGGMGPAVPVRAKPISPAIRRANRGMKNQRMQNR